MKKTESFHYILFAGKQQDSLYPICAYKTKEDAMVGAVALKSENVYQYFEVTFMPEDDVDTNEVVWSNCGRK
jgi:hypothetical protein